MNSTIFREYDIRGLVPQELNPETMGLIGKAFGTHLRSLNLKTISVGGDVRTHTRGLMDAFIAAVNSTGIDQAAAITLRREPSALVTRTVGPWLIRRLACSRATAWKREGCRSMAWMRGWPWTGKRRAVHSLPECRRNRPISGLVAKTRRKPARFAKWVRLGLPQTTQAGTMPA